MNENIGNDGFLTRDHACVIFINNGNTRARIGWISHSTGLTYCGICLRAAVTPEIGKSCAVCGARVALVFTIGGDPNSIRNACKGLLRQTAGWALRDIG
jgi:hypothetical protein